MAVVKKPSNSRAFPSRMRRSRSRDGRGSIQPLPSGFSGLSQASQFMPGVVWNPCHLALGRHRSRPVPPKGQEQNLERGYAVRRRLPDLHERPWLLRE